MLLATDTDLARIEPNLHNEIVWFSQRLIKATGTVGGTTLAISAFDTNFDGAQLAAGMIVVVAGVPHEVIAKLTSTTAQISRIRPTSGDELLTPAAVSNVETVLSTFRQQIAIVSDQVYRALGLDPKQTGFDAFGAPAPVLKQPESLARFTSLWTLATIYAAASSLQGPDSVPGRRAAYFRDLLADERRYLAANIDTNNDGIADALRRPSLIPLLRA